MAAFSIGAELVEATAGDDHAADVLREMPREALQLGDELR